MSDMVERTLTALPGLFLQNQLGGPAASRAPFFSRLGGLIRGVTALSSKHVGRREIDPAGTEQPEGDCFRSDYNTENDEGMYGETYIL
ncbi:hypothetical protein ACRRTK_013765 [Alexandromys fortis]